MNAKKIYVKFVNEVRRYIEENSDKLGFYILYGNSYSGYFTVQNKYGYRSYCQISRFNQGLDVGISYKPSAEFGSGCHIGKPMMDIDSVIAYINIALKGAVAYPRDLRMPKSKNSGYLI